MRGEINNSILIVVMRDRNYDVDIIGMSWCEAFDKSYTW